MIAAWYLPARWLDAGGAAGWKAAAPFYMPKKMATISSPSRRRADRRPEDGFHRVRIHDSGQVGRAYGAKTTPHLYVINPNSVLIYKGAIDDQPGTNKNAIPGAGTTFSPLSTRHWPAKLVSMASHNALRVLVKYK